MEVRAWQMAKDTEKKERKTPAWVTVVVAAFAGGLFAALATISTGYLSFSNRDRELDIQLINISLGILRGEHDVKDVDREATNAARKFAILTISRLAETQLEDNEIEAWSKGVGTPFTADPSANCTKLEDGVWHCLPTGASPIVTDQ